MEVSCATNSLSIKLKRTYSSGGSTGAMIPYIERNYNISYARVSVLFVSTFIGYVTAAAATGPLVRRVGFGKTLLIAMVVELIGVSNFIAKCSHRLTVYHRFV